jgi:uncharacterized protein (TIGR00661 family)
MARIMYGVAGDGFGHGIRSKVVIERLKKKHDIRIVASGKAYWYLSKYFKVDKIGQYSLVYRNNKVAALSTILYNLVRSPAVIVRSWKISSIIREFKPDVIITDFEPFVDYFAFFKRVPVISVNNQHQITNVIDKQIPKKYWFDVLITKIVIKLFIVKSNRNFINSFSNKKPSDKNSFLIKPLLRENIIRMKPEYKDHILVYQTSKTNKPLLRELKKVNEKFIVYGFNIKKTVGNVTLKEFSEDEFLKDLGSSKAVITNGGFTLISEALYLKKPVLSIPIKRQFEQIINALQLKKRGYGMYAKETRSDIIEHFIKLLPKFRNNLKDYNRYDNNDAIRKIEETIISLS